MSDEYMCELDPENPGLPYNPYPITSVVLPNKLKLFAEGAFALNNLTNIIIPASIESLDELTFFCNPMLNPTFEGDPFPFIISCENTY